MANLTFSFEVRGLAEGQRKPFIPHEFDDKCAFHFVFIQRSFKFYILLLRTILFLVHHLRIHLFYTNRF